MKIKWWRSTRQSLFIFILNLNLFSILKSWYSAVLNWYILHACHEGIDVIGTIQIILFFCHQCNNTLTFSRAFSEIISERASLKKSGSKLKRINNYYSLLGRKCYEIRKPEIKEKRIKKDTSGDCSGVVRQRITSEYKSYEQSTDVGSGIHPRFTVSETSVFTDTEVDVHVASLIDICNQMSGRMASSTRDVERLHLVQYFANECK